MSTTLHDLKDIPRSGLVALLDTLTRDKQEGSARWSEVQGELARRRVAEERAEQERAEQEGRYDAPLSLRSLIIAELRKAPGSTPSQLAVALGRSTPVVSRVLAGLLENQVVAFTGTDNDRRVRHYALVEGVSEAESMTKTEVLREHIALGIGAAVEARRKRHELEYARDRLERLLGQATRVGADDLALLARTELITTLRQESQTAPAQETVRARHLHDTASLLKAGSTFPGHLVTPAIGALEYELGRDKSKAVDARLKHLIGAEIAFGRCEGLERAHDWCPREGWALLERGDLWRKETEFGKAQALATSASRIFENYDDPYGMAEARRLLGFCQRLRGDFDGAIETLESALVVGEGAASDRCRADVMLQLGDALRCRGDFDEATDYLCQAEELARALGRTTTLGFVLTSLAAIQFALMDMDEARALALKARQPLAAERSGTAMNDRRLAVIYRELADGGERELAAESAVLFEQSLASYKAIDSPAGVAACLVGIGKISDEQQGSSASKLKSIASSADGRMLLPMDPWLPSLVTEWADEAPREEVQEIIEWTFQDAVTEQAVPEMAAEPRRLSMVDA